MGFHVDGSVSLVTGANQGIGRGFVEGLLERDVKRIYAAARRPETLDEIVDLDPKRIVPLTLDVTKAQHRDDAAKVATDVTFLINNAGIGGSSDPKERSFLSATSLEDARSVMETDFFAQVGMCRSFAPIIVGHGGGAILNILSIGALFCVPEYSSYSAAKAAAAMMTQGIRAELFHKNVFVAGAYTAGVETRMSAKGHPTISPLEHARDVFAAMERGEEDLFEGAGGTMLRDMFRNDPKALERRNIERFHTAPLNSGG